MDSRKGKPWAEIQYHKSLNVNMGANIVEGLVVDILMVALICWILTKLAELSFGRILTACVLTGIIVFINSPFTVHIWYPKADIMVHLVDALVSWAACGAWLGWWLPRK